MTDTADAIAAARALHQTGAVDRAEGAYRAIVEAEPGCAEAWHLLGVVAVQKGDAAGAEGHIVRALGLDGEVPRYHNTLATVCAHLGRPEEAERCLRQALALDPGFVDAWYNLGIVLRDLKRSGEAEAAYRRTLDEDPDHLDALNNLGLLIMARHRLKEAEAILRRARDLDPAHTGVLWNLASCLEKRNRLDEAHGIVEELLKSAPDDVATNLIAARLERRQGDLESAAGRLQTVLTKTTDDGVRLDANFDLGLVLDRLERSAEAFQAFARANDCKSVKTEAAGIDGAIYLDQISHARQWFGAERLAAWGAAPPADEATTPVIFFVGFPRSGTTLMEQILAAHPALVTTGENSPLESVRVMMRKERPGGEGYPECLEMLNPADIRHWRQEFWTNAQTTVGTLADGRVLVDKLPLNLVHLGMVNRLFPEAKVVVALRDPRDVCLSCFFQNFRPTIAMVNFQSVEGAATLYAQVMDLWFHYRSHITMAWTEYRYEDLIADMEGTARRILEFMDLEWNDDVLNYREAARLRTISTPSYRDVGERLYGRAAGRWRRYEDRMAPVLPLLEPYVEAFGYAREGS
ncbi:MAG TPA: sulfotransferase [Rhodospirillales bacterium]|nr:sulfotransferase [Rhodospirillales bacterium]